MEFRRTFSVPEWNADVQKKVIEYWRGRGVTLRPIKDGQLVGPRGSLWGNLGSTNIAKVITTVSIRHDNRQLECVIQLDTRFRTVFVWDRKYLGLELETFESFLLYGDLKSQLWLEHMTAASKARKALISTALRRSMFHSGPMVIEGDLKLKSWITLFLAIVFSAVTYCMGSRLATAIYTLLGGSSERWSGVFGQIFFGLMAIVMGIALFAASIWLRVLGRSSAKCVSVEEAAKRLDMQVEQIRHAIETRTVKPRFIKDGEPVYDISEITGAAHLLRPVEHRGTTELLHPVATSQSAASKNLLRPDCSRDSDDQPNQIQGVNLS